MRKHKQSQQIKKLKTPADSANNTKKKEKRKKEKTYIPTEHKREYNMSEYLSMTRKNRSKQTQQMSELRLEESSESENKRKGTRKNRNSAATDGNILRLWNENIPLTVKNQHSVGRFVGKVIGEVKSIREWDARSVIVAYSCLYFSEIQAVS